MADVPEIINTAQGNTQTWVNQAEAFLNRLADLANERFDVEAPAPIGVAFSGITQEAVDQLLANKPSRPSIGQVDTNVPTAPSIDIGQAEQIDVPDLSATAPTLDFGQAPSFSTPSKPVSPNLNDPVIPDAPVLTFPTLPTFGSVAFPEPPSIQIPEFTATAPVDELLEPSNTFNFYEQAYESALLDDIKAKLIGDLANGGYGIEPNDEAALWARSREREDIAAESGIEEIKRQYTHTGFPLPTGVLFNAVARADEGRRTKLSGHSREVALRRSELYQQNRQFTIQTGISLEQALLGYHGAVQERALNFARATAEVAIAYFDMKVKRFNALMDAYKTEAQVFESKIRAELAQAEIYRTQIQAKGLEIDAQRQLVEIYKAQLAGIQSLVDVYKARMEAANIQATIERQKIETFRAQVDAFVAEIQAKNAEVNLYEARIRGEAEKVRAFEAQVRAHGELVNTAKTKADIALGNIRAQAEKANAEIALYNGQIAGFRARLEAQTENIKASTDVYRADIALMQAVASATGDAFRVQVEEMRVHVNTLIETVRTNIASAKLALEAFVAVTNVRLGAAKAGSETYAGAVSGALSSVNALAAQIENTEK